MYSKETPVQLVKNNKIVMKEYEILLLDQLLIHRILHAKSIHIFFNQMAGHPLHENAISNRLRRMVDMKILDRVTRDVSVTSAKVLRYYYKLGIRAYRILLEMNRLENTKENLKRFKNSRRSVVPSVHSDAISILANQIFLNHYLYTKDGIKHIRGAEIRLPNEKKYLEPIQGFNLVVPDWALFKDNHIIFLEMDTGSQDQGMIAEKILKYNILIKNFLLPANITASLIFTVLDDSIDVVKKNKKMNREKRVASLKKTIAAQSYQGFSIYAVTAKRASAIVQRILMDKEEDYHQVLKNWGKNIQETLEHINQKKSSWIEVGTYIPMNSLSTQSILVLRHEKKNVCQYILPVYMLEGNVEMFSIFKEFMKNISTYKKNLETTYFDVFLVYPSLYEAEWDVLGINEETKVYKTDVISWEKSFVIPQMIRVTSSFSQEFIYGKERK